MFEKIGNLISNIRMRLRVNKVVNRITAQFGLNPIPELYYAVDLRLHLLDMDEKTTIRRILEARSYFEGKGA